MFVTLLIASLLTDITIAIFDGKNGSIKDFPYQVSIEYYTNHICDGAIIDKNWIVTVSHYCAERSTDELRVRAGTDLRGKGGTLHKIDKIIKHSGFQHDSTNLLSLNDIALMHVREPFKFDRNRQPVKMYESTEKVVPDKMANVSGFGFTSYHSDVPKNLQWVQVPVLDFKNCDKAYKNTYGRLPKGFICGGGKSACFGDEGGPLVVEGRLAGVVSYFSDCTKAHYPTMYTEIGSYRLWIDQQLRKFAAKEAKKS